MRCDLEQRILMNNFRTRNHEISFLHNIMSSKRLQFLISSSLFPIISYFTQKKPADSYCKYASNLKK